MAKKNISSSSWRLTTVSDKRGQKSAARILVSAYACHPPTSAGETGEENILGAGESILGWNLVSQVSRFHETWVLTQRRNRRGIERAAARGEMKGVRFVYLDFPLWRRSWWSNEIALHAYYYAWQARAALLARRLHDRIGFDLAHHATFANYWMPSFIGAYLPVPFVWGPLGGGQRTPRSFLRDYPLAGRISDAQRAASQWIGRTLLFSHRRCLRRARAILTCNCETRAKIPARYDAKVGFFPVNGIGAGDLAVAEPADAGSRPFTVFSTGRLIHWKNFPAAIRAFEIFSGRAPEARFVIAGEGPERRRLEALIRERGLERSVRLIGWLPQQELFSRMRGADVFLYPSLREGGGAVVVEAMAAGLPVVCLDNSGPGFHVRPEWGIKIPPRDTEFIVGEMAAALERLYRDRGFGRALGRAARSRAESFYMWDRLGERLLEIYRRALDPGAGGA
jgi:glycosyltransferase involved in cell wall biosynthesis